MPIHHPQSVKIPHKLLKNTAFPGTAVGVDGCRGGWCAVIVHAATLTVTVYPAWAQLLADLRPKTEPAPHPPTIAVDMPIGLTETGPRACDVLARKKLRQNYRAGKNLAGPSSVFPAPCRPMLACDTYAQANAWGRSNGAGLSKQAWNLKQKIVEIDRAITPDCQDTVIEAHPELAFLRLNGEGNLATKRSAQGHQQRRTLLHRHGVPVDEIFASLGPEIAGVQPDDLADACVLALLATDIAQWHIKWRTNQRARTYPHRLTGPPHTDGRGLRMEIYY